MTSGTTLSTTFYRLSYSAENDILTISGNADGTAYVMTKGSVTNTL